MVDHLELEPERTADHEAQVAPALAPLLEELAEADRVEGLAPRSSSDTNARSGSRRATCSSSRTSMSSSRAWRASSFW